MGSLDGIANQRRNGNFGTLDQVSANRRSGQTLLQSDKGIFATTPPKTKTPPKKKGGGGFLGEVERVAHKAGNAVAGTIGENGHLLNVGYQHTLHDPVSWTAGKGALAGDDLKAIIPGLYDAGKWEYLALKHDALHSNLGKHESLHDFLHGSNNPADKHVSAIEKGMLKGTYQPFEHPFRDPFQTLLAGSALFSAGASTAGRLGAAGDAARAGDLAGAVKGLTTKPTKVRPGLVPHTDNATTPIAELPSTKNYGRGLLQTAHDKLVQKAIDSEAANTARGAKTGALTTTVSKYGNARIGNWFDEVARGSERADRAHAIRTIHNLNNLPPSGTEKATAAAATDARITAFDRLQAAGEGKPEVLKAKVGKEPLPLTLGKEARAAKGITDAASLKQYRDVFKKEFQRHLDAIGQTGQVGEDFKPVDVKTVQQTMTQAQRAQSALDQIKNIDRISSTTKRSARDVLINDADTKKMLRAADELKPYIDQLKATGRWNEYTATEVNNAIQGLLKDAGNTKFSRAEKTVEGTAAPEGFRWIDPMAAKDLLPTTRLDAALAGSKLGSSIDFTNSLATAATVYMKLGHIPTRIMTNGAAAAMQGSLGSIPKAWSLYKSLSPDVRDEIMARGGKTATMSMPGLETQAREGKLGAAADWASGVAKHGIKGKLGAEWYAKNFDAPFRFLSFVYEAQKEGFKTPQDLTRLVKDPRLTAKVNAISSRANRGAIAYDRLSPLERNALTKLVWFYPWIKGSSNFLAHTIGEEPNKALALGLMGKHGEQVQDEWFGGLPTFNRGLIGLAGKGSGNPLTTNFDTFSPFSTPADILDIPKHGALYDDLTPADRALVDLVTRKDPYGRPSKDLLLDALTGLIAPTPEGQTLLSIFNPPKPWGPPREFNRGPGANILRGLLGPWSPSHFNTYGGARALQRQRTGQ